MVALVGDEAPHVVDDLLAWIAAAQLLHLIGEPGRGVCPNGEVGGLVLHLPQEGRLLHVDRCSTKDQVGALDEPVLQRLEEAQQGLLLEDIAMPM